MFITSDAELQSVAEASLNAVPSDSTSIRKQESSLCFAVPEPGPQIQHVLAGSQLCVLAACAVAEPHPNLLSVVTCNLVGFPKWVLRPAMAGPTS